MKKVNFLNIFTSKHNVISGHLTINPLNYEVYPRGVSPHAVSLSREAFSAAETARILDNFWFLVLFMHEIPTLTHDFVQHSKT